MFRPMRRDEKLFCELYMQKALTNRDDFFLHIRKITKDRREGVGNGLFMCLYQKEAPELFKEYTKKHKIKIQLKKEDEKLFCEIMVLKAMLTKTNFKKLVLEKSQDTVFRYICFSDGAKELFNELNVKYKVELPY